MSNNLIEKKNLFSTEHLKYSTVKAYIKAYINNE